MKRVLITGANSYIGTSFEKYVKENNVDFEIDTLDLLNPKWDEFDFTPYDSIFHVAAIVHKNKKKINPDLYFSVNRDLPVKLANIAKAQGVKQFVFLSSMSVYGNHYEEISFYTKEIPNTYYGKSKLEAEKLLEKLDSNSFKVVILRPPMVYGPNAKGNYSRLSKLSKILVVFPKVENQRSMIFIDNLLEFIVQIILREKKGVFFPQNAEYVNTSELLKLIGHVHGKKIYLTKLFNPFINLLFKFATIKKIFGNLVYDKELSSYDFEYQIRRFEESIRLTEEGSI
ncbi:NAD-dependent epimerase/dehydratase family protein [Streptococcus suis]|uniref:NAD-dependent epimerase/dehydratase family protein n=1 Tax=Streptococcus suis TaxID=1307 RepID=UPI002B164C91|nr:NAD-dependent epimerase/dehydratase family protein [Streptococcus suis]